MSNGNGKGKLEDLTDLVVEGFHRLEDKLIHDRPPKIIWEPGFEARSDFAKIEYLKKLASTMNHAAYLIQEERNKLNTLIVLKEQQLEQMSLAMQQNMDMLQSEVTKMNQQRQHYSLEVSRLNDKIRELEEKPKSRILN